MYDHVCIRILNMQYIVRNISRIFQNVMEDLSKDLPRIDS